VRDLRVPKVELGVELASKADQGECPRLELAGAGSTFPGSLSRGLRAALA
jgi:hypothetical protein